MTESKRGISPNHHFGLNHEAAAKIESKLNNIDKEGFGDTFKIPVVDAAKASYEHLESLKQQIADTTADAQKAKQKAYEAYQEAHIDSLTGLYNRRHLDNYIKNFDNGKKPVIVFCDVDNLGAVNKLSGDKEGDDLIVTVSKKIKDSVRDKDLVIRKGGDEFVVIIEDYSNFEELNDKLSQRLKSKQILGPTFSFGIVQYDESQDSSLIDTIQRADDKMKEDYPNKRIVKP